MKLRFSPIQLITLSFFFTLLVIASCSKENSQSASDQQQEQDASMASSESDGEAEMIFNNVFDNVVGVNDSVGLAGVGIFGRLTSCYTVTVIHLTASAIFPVKVIIDFGTVGCLGNDGHVRKGKIITEYSSRLILPGAVATTTFDGFYVDSIKVEGTHKITNTSTNSVSRQFTTDVTDAKLSKPSGDYTQWNSHKVITQTEGLTSPDPHDDAFSITGSAHGTVKRGNLLVGWESTVTEPLIKRFNCHWIVKGKVRTVRVNTSATGQWVAVLDFGDGNCDNMAVITINGVSHNITLH